MDIQQKAAESTAGQKKRRKTMRSFREFLFEEDGIGVVELILVLVEIYTLSLSM